jgi:hypothetical protein
VREMSISENYEGEITPIRSNISRFSRATIDEIINDVAPIRSDLSRFSRGTLKQPRMGISVIKREGRKGHKFGRA